ncbi:transcription initiation factor TFIID subunit 3-like isoform X1 [Dinothrombium tinctorium]|uniref:Transcription initiation factor TFIID subunit 3-like isoform X1 n=1 Tax=Dinothrombium tinctorium TaxID=1965070 RepID=A0A443QNF5_9ACAR|nr:transcription initiation factor TFIID subunit 3-like isoform X1 [Dinothrombium tinctorium]
MKVAKRKRSSSGKTRGRPPKHATLTEEREVEEDDSEEEKIWLCPHCNKVDDGTPMIGCDGCEDWYHWVCVGIFVKPKSEEIWLCPKCKKKKKTASSSKALELEQSGGHSQSAWLCQSCKKSLEKKPSIGCDGCDKWYHWQCVGIVIPPQEDESWFCRDCIAKQTMITQKLSSKYRR